MFSRENEFNLHDNEYYFHISFTSERIYATRGFQNPLFVISEQYILFIHLFIFTTTLQVIEKSIVGPMCTVYKRIYFFSYLFVFILVPRLSGKEQLLSVLSSWRNRRVSEAALIQIIMTTN